MWEWAKIQKVLRKVIMEFWFAWIFSGWVLIALPLWIIAFLLADLVDLYEKHKKGE